MKIIKYNIALLFCLFFIAPVFNGCTDKDFLEEEIKDRILADNLFGNHTGFEASLNGLYATILDHELGSTDGTRKILARPLYILWNQGMDNTFAALWGKDNEMPQLLMDRNNSEVTTLYGAWSWLYKIVNISNTIIGRAEEEDIDWEGSSDQEALENKMRVIGEARCIRGWAYRYLTNMWGDVPLITEESTSSNVKENIVRTPLSEVEAQIEEDLKFAIENLPLVPVRPGKVSAAAANHYLAELYLRWKQYDKAIEAANKVINSGEYSLVTERYGVKAGEPGTPFTDMFAEGNVARSKGNTEVLWSWHREYEVIGGENHAMLPRWNAWSYDRYTYDHTNKKLHVTYERGGRGVAAMDMTRWAHHLWEDQDDRNSEHAIRRFYILEPGDGIDLNVHQYGDTIWVDAERDEKWGLQGLWPSLTKNEWSLVDNPKTAQSFQDQNYVRLAETYFLRAEAEIYLGLLDDAAISLNNVRTRSNATPVTGADVDIDYLLDERSRELAYEEQRKFVLVRNNKYVERITKYNKVAGPNVTERDRLWPIPQPELDLSPETMVQNPGY